jgi:hypothetical protein
MEKSLDKKKMQNVQFKSIGEFLDFLPEEELKIIEFLREFAILTLYGIIPNPDKG